MARLFALLLGSLTVGTAAVNLRTSVNAPTLADVEKLHKKLEVVAANVEGMLAAKDGVLAHAKVAPALQVFTKELDKVLKETTSIKDPAVAMKKLLDAKAGMGQLTKELSHRQEDLMKENDEQKESLLLGVLMTKKGEPMDAQMEILEADDFADLDVSKALIAKHDDKTPLFAQAADYLDKHKNHVHVAVHEMKAPNKESLAASLEKRVKALQDEYDQHEARHAKLMKGMDVKLKKSTAAEQHTITMMKKKEERQFKKWAATRQHDIKAMKMAVDAVKKGDMKELAKAKSALEASLKNLQGQNSGFLVLLQEGHKLMESDCPYCAAQCVDKCHQEGKPYVQCMTDCADAGKGF